MGGGDTTDGDEEERYDSVRVGTPCDADKVGPDTEVMKVGVGIMYADEELAGEAVTIDALSVDAVDAGAKPSVTPAVSMEVEVTDDA